MTTAAAVAARRFSFLGITLLLRLIVAAAIPLITPSLHLTTQETLVSAGQVFELGFFNNSDSWYVGIWYKNIPTKTIIWVANRDSPVVATSPRLIIAAEGHLALVDDTGRSIWFSNFTAGNPDTVAELLDNGNLIVRPADDAQNHLWQGFHHPTDTLMPGMKLGWDSQSGVNRFITSWRSLIDPSSGDYSFKLETRGFPEVYLRNRGNMIYRSGPWNGIKFSGEPEMAPNHIVFYNFVMNPDEVTYSYNLFNQSIYSRLTLNPSGSLQRLTWVPASRTWSLYWYAPKDQCDDFGECGPNGICDVSASPVCKCLNGFQPKNPQAWSLRDGSEGCVLGGTFDCGTDGFVQLINVKLPAAAAAMVDVKMSPDQCKEACRGNCSCRAYAVANITGSGSGCAFWAEDLYDMRQFAPSETGQNMYLRLPASLLDNKESYVPRKVSKRRFQAWKIAVIAVSSAVFLLATASCCFVLWRKRKQRNALPTTVLSQRGTRERSQELLLGKTENLGDAKIATEELDLPLYDLQTLLMATDEFSDSNKLGRGGFGTVYKGKLEDGQEIAVKRLSKTSVQGNEEFTNEVKMIARLQHRNLVRLLGCCIEMEEKMLIYEYMENKSLDSVLFKKESSSRLDWPSRFNIICGISRGLLYLHQDSRFRIIHRDLKPSNVLLDKNMNPKISDFGMARIFGGDQTEAETIRIVGTYGYMSPEYAMGGIFSTKSDVFSFGILVLEIVCGTKNRRFSQSNDNDLNLPAYAWKLLQGGRSVELLDPTIAADSEISANEVARCIRVALLCVQEQPDDRPSMSNVVIMLSSDDVSVPRIKYPEYFLGRDPDTDPEAEPAENNSSKSKREDSGTENQITVTILQGR